jgi:peptidoglycan/LPS O-acetylase OafA/YrhL
MAVVAFHLTPFEFMEPVARVAQLGYAGVSVFFVLSGFILVYSYWGRPLDIPHFARARFARIYPAYLFSLALTAPAFFTGTKIAPGALGVVSAFVLTMTQSWFPLTPFAWNKVLWSVSVEAFFYLVFPIALSLLGRMPSRRLLQFAALLWLLNLACPVAYLAMRPDGIVNPQPADFAPWLNVVRFNPMVRLPEFLIGMCCGLLLLAGGGKQKHVPARYLITAGVALIAALIGFQPVIPYVLLHNCLFIPASAAIIYGLALAPNRSSWFRSAPLLLLGEASYCLYLLHPLCIALFFFHNGQKRFDTAYGAILFLAIALASAVAVHLFIEAPLRRKLMRHRSARQISGDRSEAVAVAP